MDIGDQMPIQDQMRKSIRLKNHDYSSEGIYFVTICTEGRQYLLGEKHDDHIVLSKIGLTVKDTWARIGSMYEGVVLDAYSVMPDHIHGILIYSNNNLNSKPLSQIIRNFKSYTTHVYYSDKERLTGNLWRRGYYEHVIRYDELDKIRDYILKNPVDWENDEFYNLERLYMQSM